MNTPVTLHDLWKQAADQVDPTEALNAAEGQTDLNAYALINLILDIQNYNGTGKITLSTKTTNALAALQLVEAQSLITDADVSTPATSKSIQATIAFKKFVRGLQAAYYATKQKLGF